jgi:nicotinate-nucleotide pyrophosphorylase (carboxylating)
LDANIVNLALAEDLGQGDVTSQGLVPAKLQGQATILVKADGRLAGGEVAREVFLKVDPSLKIELLLKDGAKIKPGDIVATVTGSLLSILKAERVAINFLQKLSGIASQTARYVTRTNDSKARIVDTRKTTPGLRQLEKQAVLMGGGHNHRFNLGDGILIKDNHLAALRSTGMTLKDIVIKAKKNAPQGMTVEVEVTTLPEAREAAEAGADIILLDNMTPDEMRRVVEILPGEIKTEASGGITLDNIEAVAASGVDIISIGALTHSSQALDISLEIEF